MGHLRLVQSAGASAEVRRSTVDGVQVALFPDPRTVVLVRMDEETGANLPALLQKVRPRWVADLRPMPRFDFGFLSRSRVFRTFADLAISYLDLGGAPEASAMPVNDHVSRALNAILGKTTEGPMVLLLEAGADTSRACSLLSRDQGSQIDSWNILVQ